MAQTVLITLTTAGSDTGPFNLFSDVDGYVTPFESGISKAALLAGYTSVVVPDGATIIRVLSDNLTCSNYVDLVISGTTTTTTTMAPTTTTTTTAAPTTTTTTTITPTTTTTTTVLENYTINIFSCDTCVAGGTGVVSGATPLLVGKFYFLPANLIGEVTGATASVPTHTILDFTPHNFCGEAVCP